MRSSNLHVLTSALASKMIWLFICLSLLMRAHHSLATNTLNQGVEFSSSSRLNSPNGLFTLGFSAGYLVINYTIKDYISQPVWSANREKPMSENSTGVLTIDEFGRLKITHGGGDPIVIFSGKQCKHTATNITAILEDNGNFVLKQQQDILWQSFDHPTDTLLPGMKLGIDKKNKRKWYLTSWLSENNPTKGAFTLEWDPMEGQVIVRRRGIRFWSGGALTPHKKYTNTFETLLQGLNSRNYIIKRVSNEDEDYITYSTDVEKIPIPLTHDPVRVKISRWFLDYKGNVMDATGPDGVYNILYSDSCDGSNTQEGCENWESPLMCRKDGDRFLHVAGNFQPQYMKWVDNKNLSFIDCKDECWNWEDCNCTAFNYDQDSGCLFYLGSYGGEASLNAADTYVGVQADMYILEPGPPPPLMRRIWIWILTVVTVVPTIILAAMFWYLRWRKLKQEEKFLKELLTWERPEDGGDELEDGGDRNQTLKVYRVATLKSATNSFSLEHKLGEGGFGPVYKGRLTEGIEIAVKRLSQTSGQGLVEFKNELLLIAKLQHMNLVRLLGFCIQEEERLLVYEYLPNKSLDFYIFGDESRRKQLDWNKRFSIIEGIAQGLLYLHRYSRLRIIHRDLKVSNILLDKEMNPKISDFGLARIFGANENEAMTSKIVGTRRYMSPEYLVHGIFSMKSDIYSFGVLILEIISGKKNQNVHDYESMQSLVGYAWDLWKWDNTLKLLDPTLRDSVAEEQALRCINVGLLCVEERPSDRPNMSDVLSMLTSDLQLPIPKHPAFCVGESIATSVGTQEENQSANALSLSDMNGR